jgi:hypothetical protein
MKKRWRWASSIFVIVVLLGILALHTAENLAYESAPPSDRYSRELTLARADDRQPFAATLDRRDESLRIAYIRGDQIFVESAKDAAVGAETAVANGGTDIREMSFLGGEAPVLYWSDGKQVTLLPLQDGSKPVTYDLASGLNRVAAVDGKLLVYGDAGASLWQDPLTRGPASAELVANFAVVRGAGVLDGGEARLALLRKDSPFRNSLIYARAGNDAYQMETLAEVAVDVRHGVSGIGIAAAPGGLAFSLSTKATAPGLDLKTKVLFRADDGSLTETTMALASGPARDPGSMTTDQIASASLARRPDGTLIAAVPAERIDNRLREGGDVYVLPVPSISASGPVAVSHTAGFPSGQVALTGNAGDYVVWAEPSGNQVQIKASSTAPVWKETLNRVTRNDQVGSVVGALFNIFYLYVPLLVTLIWTVPPVLFLGVANAVAVNWVEHRPQLVFWLSMATFAVFQMAFFRTYMYPPRSTLMMPEWLSNPLTMWGTPILIGGIGLWYALSHRGENSHPLVDYARFMIVDTVILALLYQPYMWF